MRFAKRNPSRSPRVRRPAAEPLERRLLMAVNSWVSAVSGDWDDPTKWSLGHVPLATEDVDITVAGTYTVSVTGGQVANTVTLGTAGNPGPALEMVVADLTVSSGFTNYGAITLDNTGTSDDVSNLVVTSGTLTNAAGATITDEGVAGEGSPDQINADLVNAGTVTVTAPKGLGVTDEASGSDVAGNTATINLAGGGLLLTEVGTFTNTGTITVASGTPFAFVTPTTGTFDQAGGSLGGTGAALSFSGGTVDLMTAFAAATLAVTGGGTVSLGTAALTAGVAFTVGNGGSGTIDGPGTLTNSAGQTLTLDGLGTINAPLVNQGTIVSTGGTIGGPLSTAAGSAVDVDTQSLTVSSGFTNYGAITLDNTSTSGGNNSALTVTSGTLTNAAGATITDEGVVGESDNDRINAELVNAGTLTVTAPMGLAVTDESSGTTVGGNTGTINVGGGGLTLSEDVTFTNTGTIAVASGVPFAFVGAFAFVTPTGTFDQAGGSLGGTGAALSFSGGTVDLTTAFTAATLSGTGGVTLSLGSAASTAGVAVTLAIGGSATVNGPGALTNSAGETLTLGGGATINTPVVNQGTIVSTGGTIGGTFTTTAGSVLDVDTYSLTIAAGFTNYGAITLENTSTDGQNFAAVAVTSGTLTNAAGARITDEGVVAESDNDQINADLVNAGTITATAPMGLAIDGTFTQTATGTFASAIGVTPTPISGVATLGGTLVLSVAPGVAVSSGNTYAALRYTSASGAFATVDTSALTGLTVATSAAATAYNVVVNSGTLAGPARLTLTPVGGQPATAAAASTFDIGILVGGGTTGPYTVDIDWGDGTADTTVSMTADGHITAQAHTYAAAGTDTVSVTATDAAGHATAVPATFTVAVGAAAPVLTGTLTITAGAAQTATARTPGTFALGTLATTGAPAPYTVTVNWGDGSADTTFTMAAAGAITPQAHMYAAAATDTVSVTATDAVGDASNAATFTVAVAAVAATTATVTVHVYDDPGQTGSTATPLAGRTVFVDANGNGVLDAGEQLAVTGADGSATLAVPVGQASEIGEVLPVNVGQSQPSTADAAVAGDAAGDTVNFFTKTLSATAAATGAFYSDYSLSSLPAGFETDDVVTQPDGKLLVAGTDRAGATPTAFVARFFADGEADLNFGVDGIADGPANSVAANVVEEPDGTVYLASNGAGTATVTGFTAAGAASTIAAYTTAAPDAATAAGLTLMADGSLLLSGTVYATSAAATTGTAFLTDLAEATLQPVATFGTAGTVLGTVAGVSLIGPAQVTPTGTLDVFAEPLDGSGLALDSYSAAGVLGSATSLAAALGTGFTPRTAAVQADGQVIVAGLGSSASGADDTVTVARLNADGSADTTFGTADGLVSEDDSSLVAAAGTLALCAAEVLPDGTVLVTGKYDDAATATYQCFCQEYTSAGAVELGYGQTNSLVVTTDTAAGVAALATATGVLPVATATAAAAAGEAVPVALIDGSVGFPLPVMLTARAVADLVVESAPPTAALQPLLVNPVTAATAAAAEQLVVEYADPIAVDLQTVASGNLQVTGPGGTTLSATFAGFEPTGDAQGAFATYTVAPAGGAWTAADNGSYAVALLANQVRNTAVYAAADATLGTFTVDVGGTAGAAATTVTVTPGAASAKTGNLLAFTVTVASATAGPAPTGTVTFADGAGLLGTATLAGGTATFATAALPAGSADVVTATYSGDGTYAAGTSSTATVAVAGPAAGAAALTPSLPHAILPAAVVAGSKLKLSLPLAITDGGGAAEKGTVTVNLYASTDATLDGGDTLVATIARAVSIKAGRATTVKLALTSLPASLAEGTYHLLAQVVDAAGFAQTAASGGTVTVAAPFTDPTLSFARLTGPTTLSAGGRAHGSALLTLADGGNVPLSGSVTVTLYLTADGAVDAAAPVVRTVVERVDIPAGKAKTVSVPLSTIPATLVAGSYQFAASVAAPAVDGAAAASATAVDPAAITVTA